MQVDLTGKKAGSDEIKQAGKRMKAETEKGCSRFSIKNQQRSRADLTLSPLEKSPNGIKLNKCKIYYIM